MIPETQSNQDRRSFYRIDDSVVLTYRQVAEAELAETVHAPPGDLQDAFTLASTFAGISHETRLLRNQVRSEAPAIARYLEALDRKLDILSQVLLIQEVGPHEERTLAVNLSAGGMEFEAREPLVVDTWLELRFVLLPSRTGILAGGRVIRSDALESRDAFRLAVEFSHIRESDRQLLVKHVLGRQSERLRQRWRPGR